MGHPVFFSKMKFLESSLSVHCTEVRFASFLSGGSITAILVNPPESKVVKRTSVHCTDYEAF